MSKETKTKKPRNTVTLSLSKGYEKEIEHFNEQANRSKYVWELIREDMKRQDRDKELLEMMKQTMSSLNGNERNSVSVVQSVNTLQERNNSQRDKMKKGAMSFLQD